MSDFGSDPFLAFSNIDPMTSWLERLILRYAVDLEASIKTIFQFANRIRAQLHRQPIQEWEAALWARGLNRGLIRQKDYFFRVGTGRRSSLSFFVRNETDAYVGLRREAITQAATYVSLVTEYNYPRPCTRCESQWMDVAVYDQSGSAWIYAENKANQKTLEKLCGRLSTEFSSEVPAPPPEGRKADDAVMKANHIWRHRPRYFWAVCPTNRLAFEVQFNRSGGFRLVPALDIPSFPHPGPSEN